MELCPSLRPIQKSLVVFDPTNKEHLKAFEMLCLGESRNADSTVKQHPTLRFELEDKFLDVRSMMYNKVGQYYLENYLP